MDGVPLGLGWLRPHFPDATIRPLAQGPRKAAISWQGRELTLIAAPDHYYIVDDHGLSVGISFSRDGERLMPGYPPV
jgi:hypothetical protein